jgi:acyl-coenzyme A synthetase/AMP-(fatty) acid ligase
MSARPESLPNSASNAPTCVAAWRNGRALSSQAMLSEARALADQLPTQGFAINLCTDRYAFAVAWLACLLRGLTMGLPQDVLPTTLGRLAEQAWAEQPDQSLLALTDVTVPGSALPAPWTSISVGTPPAGAVPDFPLDGWSMEAEAARNAEHVAVKLYTSGSTGSPKAQAKTWHELLRNARGQYTRLCEYLQQASLQCHTVVGTVPPQHSYGLESTVMLPLLGGARLSNRRPYLPDDVRAALEEVPAPRMLVTTPFHLRMLMESGLQWPTVELVLCATAPLSRELAVMAEQAFCGQLIEIYGCTEAGQLASRRTTHTETWQTLGDIRIDARAMPSDPAGCEAPEVVYWASQGHIPCPVPLADRLDLLDAHHFHLRGRTQDLVHVAGKRTSLGHLNQLLQCIPGVQDGVFWLPAEQADRVVRPVAFVVAPGLEPGLIRDQLRPLMDPVFLPRRLILVEALPREPSGKLTQARMADLAAQHLGPAPAAEAI